MTKSVDLQAHTQLFSLAKVHLTRAPPTPSAMPGNASLGGKDRGWTACREFAICGWDGMTYLMDVDFNTVHFNYPNRVAAFTAGTSSRQDPIGQLMQVAGRNVCDGTRAPGILSLLCQF